MAPNHQVIWIMKPTDRPSCVCDGLWIISSFESKEEEERRHKERKREKLQLRAECWIQLWFSLRPYREIITRPLRNIKTKKKKRISRERSRRSIKFFFPSFFFPPFSFARSLNRPGDKVSKLGRRRCRCRCRFTFTQSGSCTPSSKILFIFFFGLREENLEREFHVLFQFCFYIDNEKEKKRDEASSCFVSFRPSAHRLPPSERGNSFWFRPF